MSKIVVVGSFITDIAVFAPRFPNDGETLMGSRLKFGPGGKGSNQATAAKRAGAEVVMITKIGSDFMSEIALSHYKNENMSGKYIYRDDIHETGSAVIEINEATAENRIIVMLGANEYITADEVARAENEFADCDIVLLQLEASMTSVNEAIRLAKKYNKKIILNTAPLRKIDEAIFDGLDFLTPNETEAEFYSGVKVTDEESARRAAEIFMSKGAKNVVITLGKAGAYVKSKNTDAIVPSLKVEAVDTTGAGDAFNGGLAVSLAEGKDLLQAVRFANALAAVSVTRVGTSPAMPTREEIEEMMSR